MTDHYDQDLILGYVEGELTDEQRGSFEQQLAGDDELRQLVSQMRLDRQALRGLADEPAPVGLIDQVFAAQERASLLGDPEAPDPLPLAVSVNRHKLRRVLVYGSIAAVLMLSFTAMFQTLIPLGLLEQQPMVVSQDQDQTLDSPALADSLGSSFAMVDEDRAYDDLASPQPLSKKRKPQAVASGASPAELLRESAESLTAAGRLALSETENENKTDTQASPVPDATAAKTILLGEKLALGHDADRVVDHPQEQADGYGESAQAGKTPAGQPLIVKLMADPNVRIEVASASPRQARRDIRDWAIANSVRFIEEPAGPGEQTAFVGARLRSMNEEAAGLVGGLAAGTADKTPMRLVVVVDDKQMPALLAYLNRTRGQRADLVADGPLKQDDHASLARRTTSVEPMDPQVKDAREEAEKDTDAATPLQAMANRLLDINSALDSNANDAPMALTQQPQQEADEEAPEDKTERSNEPAPATAVDPFDWATLLKLKPASTPTTPLETNAPRQWHIPIVIRQVPDIDPETQDTTPEVETKKTFE